MNENVVIQLFVIGQQSAVVCVEPSMHGILVEDRIRLFKLELIAKQCMAPRGIDYHLDVEVKIPLPVGIVYAGHRRVGEVHISYLDPFLNLRTQLVGVLQEQHVELPTRVLLHEEYVWPFLT